MATEVEIDTVINNSSSASGLKELRSSLKELISLQGQVGAGSANFKKLQDAINKTDSKLGDLNTSFQSLRGNGVERLNSSIGILREGFLSADPGKLSIGLEGLGAAMKAIPIFLLIEGAKLLYENWGKIAAIFDESAQAAKRNQKELDSLTNSVNVQKTQTDALLITKQQELVLLENQKKGIGEVVSKLNEINAIKQEGLRRDLELTDKALQIQYDKVQQIKDGLNEPKSITENLFGIGPSEEDLNKELKSLSELQVKRGQISNQISQTEIENTNKVDAAKKEALKKDIERMEKEKESGRLKADEFNRLLGLQQEYEDAVRAAKIADEQAANQKIIDDYLESKQVEQAINDLFRQQEKEAEDEAEKDRRLRLENDLAYSKAFQQKNLNNKIDSVKLERDTLLQNEQLTQDQRIKIIEDSENKIFQLKVQSAQAYVGYAQQIAGIVNSLNTLQTQNENYELQQQQYQKDAAVTNDQNRTQEELDREELKKNTLLNNDTLTASEREKIAYDSETRQMQISKAGKDAQDKINQDFAKKALEVKKKQFEREKALQIAQGVISTAASVLQTLASVPYPLNIPLAILAGAAGAAQVAIIASQKFDDGGASASSSVAPAQSIDTRGGISAGSPSQQSASPRTFEPTGNIVNTNRNTTNSNGNPIYVTVEEINRVSHKVSVLESRATFAD
jgi:hypothetical protein